MKVLIKTDINKISLFGRSEIKVFTNRPSTIKDFFNDTVSKYGNRTALILDDEEMTYIELDKQSNQLAASLERIYRVKKGDRLAVLVSNSFEFAIIVLACIKTGIIMVPVNTKLKPPEIAFILGHSKPKIIFCDNSLISLVEECKNQFNEIQLYSKHFVAISEEAADYVNFPSLLSGSDKLTEVDNKETDPAFILYTSGTTGRLKGAVLSHINVIHSVMHYQLVFKGNSEVRSTLAVPFFHVTGLVARFLHSVFIGGSLLIFKKYQNEQYIKQCYEKKVNVHSNVPTIYAMMATSPLLKKFSFDFVKRVSFGGGPIYQHTLEMLREIFPNATYHNVYGATETTSPSTIMPGSYPMSKASSVGKPVETADIKVIDSNENELGPNKVGELLIKGPMVIGQYWDDPVANENSFVDGYWRSGDLAKVDEDGYVYILDRKKDMINRGGEKVFSLEVEDVLKKHPDIDEVAVIAVPDKIFGERVKTFIISDTLNEKAIPEIKLYCSQFLANFKIPEIYEFIEELPKTASGKTLKHQLRKRDS